MNVMNRRRLFRALGILLIVLVVLAAMAAAAFYWVRVQRSRAELVLRGRIVTMDAMMPSADALAVRDGRIVAIGRADEVDDHVGWWTRRIDLDEGHVAVPGFIEGPGNFIELRSGVAGEGEEVRRLLTAADREASSRGITSFRDAGTTPDVVEQMKRMIDEGALHTRLWVMLRIEPGSIPPAELARAEIVGYGDHRLTVRIDTPGAVQAAPDPDVVGTLSPGKLADITVLRGEAVPRGAAADAQVLYTIVGGRTVYESDARPNGS